jgi:hypothetical protein
MDAQIIIACQTQSEIVSCESCIANKTCQLRKALCKGTEKFTQKQRETEELSLVVSFSSSQSPSRDNRGNIETLCYIAHT